MMKNNILFFLTTLLFSTSGICQEKIEKFWGNVYNDTLWPKFDFNIKNKLTIKNKTKDLQALVLLVKMGQTKKHDSVQRVAFLNAGEKHTMSSIPPTEYKIKIATGIDFFQENPNKLNGYFKENAKYQTLSNINFSPVEKNGETNFPNYKLSIDTKTIIEQDNF